MRTHTAAPLRGPLLSSLALAALWLGPSPAWAEAPHRCEAVFVGPTKECELLGTWTVSGVARTEDSARKVALGRLAALMIAALDERAAKTAEMQAAKASTGKKK